MGPVFLLDLAAQNARWLGLRQSTIAGNIANVSTPGYRAVDVRPFEEAMSRTALDLAQTAPGHMSVGSSSLRGRVLADKEGWETTFSGNSVNIEEQLLKASDVSRAYALNTGVVRSFHRMMLSGVKG